jgi:transcriptional antiterminator NusG
LKSYCIFCKSGQEQIIANKINSIYKDFKAIAPRRILQEKRNNKWEKRDLALLPGYVFLFSPEDTAESKLHERVTDMYKFLEYEDGIRDLCNADYDYAMWIYNNHGSIAPSRILADGAVIRVIDGPLLECQGKIVRLDKHKRRVLVEFDFDGSKRVISLSAECVTNLDDLQQKI